MGEKLSNIGCWLIPLLLLCGIVYMCDRNNKLEEEKKLRKEFVADSIAKREQFVKDSIDSVKHSPEYIAQMDSIRLAQQRKDDERAKRIVVMVCQGDNVYHYMTQCFNVSDMGKIRFMSKYMADKSGFKECDVCHYDDEGYVYEDEVFEFIRDHFDRSDIIDYLDIDESDFEDY